MLPQEVVDRPRFGADQPVEGPHVLLVVDGPALPPGNHLVPEEGVHGMTVIELPESWGELEDPTRLRLELVQADRGAVGVTAWRRHDEPVKGHADQLDRESAEAFARRLAPLASTEGPVREDATSTTPDLTDLLDLEDDERLELVVVDVSGKGDQAGTRALQLSGAFGGLLGSVGPEMFLASANDYLLRQDWVEGFATAVHLSLLLDTGEYEVRSAGHPPAVLRAAGSGRWSVLDSTGAVLGLLPAAEFTTARGRLERGDSLLLYTDGMVEEPRRDLEMGLDRLLGEAEKLLRGGVDGSAARLGPRPEPGGGRRPVWGAGAGLWQDSRVADVAQW